MLSSLIFLFLLVTIVNEGIPVEDYFQKLKMPVYVTLKVMIFDKDHKQLLRALKILIFLDNKSD